MASYWETPFESPTPQAGAPRRAPPEPDVPVLEDVGKGIVGGLGRGITGTLGLGGEAGNLVRRGLSAAGVPDETLDRGAAFARTLPIAQSFTGATGPEIQRAVEARTGPFYQAKTLPGQVASALTEAAPSALLPGSLAQRTLGVVAPALMSETAGQITKGDVSEPYARAIAGIAGPSALRMGVRGLTELPNVGMKVLGAAAASGGVGSLFGLPGAIVGTMAPLIYNQLSTPAGRAAVMREVGAQRDQITRAMMQQGTTLEPAIERSDKQQKDFERSRMDERRRLGLER